MIKLNCTMLNVSLFLSDHQSDYLLMWWGMVGKMTRSFNWLPFSEFCGSRPSSLSKNLSKVLKTPLNPMVYHHFPRFLKLNMAKMAITWGFRGSTSLPLVRPLQTSLWSPKGGLGGGFSEVGRLPKSSESADRGTQQC